MNIKDDLKIHSVFFQGKMEGNFTEQYVYGNKFLCIPDIREQSKLQLSQPFIIQYSYNNQFASYCRQQNQSTILVYKNPLVERDFLNKVAFVSIKKNVIQYQEIPSKEEEKIEKLKKELKLDPS